MPEVFVDTSGWATWVDKSQPFHQRADALLRQWHTDGTFLVTSNYVLVELIALLTSPLRMPRPMQVALIEDIKAAARVELVHVDPSLDQEAGTLLKSPLDKKWSWVDCASFALMQRRGISDALTTDHHFEQAGFVRLLK
jgi:predicted nucleic acid-binding protein